MNTKLKIGGGGVRTHKRAPFFAFIHSFIHSVAPSSLSLFYIGTLPPHRTLFILSNYSTTPISLANVAAKQTHAHFAFRRGIDPRNECIAPPQEKGSLPLHDLQRMHRVFLPLSPYNNTL